MQTGWYFGWYMCIGRKLKRPYTSHRRCKICYTFDLYSFKIDQGIKSNFTQLFIMTAVVVNFLFVPMFYSYRKSDRSFLYASSFVAEKVTISHRQNKTCNIFSLSHKIFIFQRCSHVTVRRPGTHRGQQLI